MNIRASSSKAPKQANLQMLVHRHTAQLLNIERPESSATRKKSACVKIMRVPYIAMSNLVNSNLDGFGKSRAQRGQSVLRNQAAEIYSSTH